MIVDRRFDSGGPQALLPEDAPFTPVQRAWLNGFFAALLAPVAAVEAVPSKPPLSVLFASQTGTAEGLAKKLVKAAKQKGFAAAARELGTLDLGAIAKLGNVAVVASTYGEGEPPDSAKAFAEMLAEASGTPLAGVTFAVLALGDRNYTHFCRFAVMLDARLGDLGASRLFERIECDVEVDAPFAQFRDAYLKALEAKAIQNAPGSASPPSATTTASDVAEEDEEPAESWSRERPYPAVLLANDRLNSAKSNKDTRHVVLSLNGSGLSYEPGDALGVVPANAPEVVASVLEATGLDGTNPATLADGTVLPLAKALTCRLAIGKLGQPTVIKFQEKAGSATLARLLDPENVQELNTYLWGRELIDLLIEYPGIVKTAEELIGLLPRLTPRLYSISSSQRAHPNEVHITVGVLRYESHGRSRKGIASSFLADQGGEDGTVPIYVHRNPRFRLPEDPGRPIVMIGPGTGVAPFRAFLEERRALAARGKAWLFFGERRAAHDFLYRREIEGFLKDGMLTRLETAFSRDWAEKVYVQHRMLEFGEELWRWISDGAHLYVCGDANQMARDVHQALQTIIVQHGRLSEAKAKLELQGLAAEGRYARDVY
jgi:sulfite reductase (NADPH) flavoprotein alpha-component